MLRTKSPISLTRLFGFELKLFSNWMQEDANVSVNCRREKKIALGGISAKGIGKQLDIL